MSNPTPELSPKQKRERFARVEEIFHRAAAFTGPQRAAFLHDACGSDRELRREVESLLDVPDTDSDLMEAPVREALEGVAREMEQALEDGEAGEQDVAQSGAVSGTLSGEANPSTTRARAPMSPSGNSPDHSLPHSLPSSLMGQQLGPYRVGERIGVGGMGEVYRAHDAQLGRDVAIKVLPREYARDAERLSRFRREARTLASLNHSNIAAIYGLEEVSNAHGATPCLVMELVPGETLAERIKRGPLPLREALEIAQQIATGLEHAHEKGIIHRDLKPANVKITAEGTVKLLDFGLAKAFVGDSGVNTAANTDDISTLTHLPPITPSTPTAPGLLLGTPAYMSPEQARGQQVDRRSDIWALGCVLYEMLTGSQTFSGPTVTDILSKVINQDPDWSTLPSGTPPSIRALLRRCLQKDAKNRSRDAADIRLQLDDALNASASAQPAMPAPLQSPPTSGWKRKALVAALVVGVAAIACLATWRARTPAPQPVSRLAISLPPGQHLAALDQPAIAISPDGKNLVYVAIQCRDRQGAGVSLSGGQDNCQDQNQPPLPDGRGTVMNTQQLYLRPLDSNEAKPIAGTESATGPFFSPDGQWIGFFAGGKLKKISVNGGEAVTLTGATNPGGASWSSQGTLALQPNLVAQGLQQVAQEGGALQPLTHLAIGETYHRWPGFLPNGLGVLFVGAPSSANWTFAQIKVQQLETGNTAESKILTQGSQPSYASSGHLLYAKAGMLMAAPFDAGRLSLSGAAVPAIEGMLQSSSTGAAQYTVSSTGSLAYLSGGVVGGQSRLVWVSRNGEEQAMPAAPHSYQFPRVSPDGKRVAVSIADQETLIWVYDIARDTFTRLTFEGNVNATPAWSPDGKRLAFNSSRAGPVNLFWQAADGSGGAERITTSDYQNTAASYSPDGQLLAYIENTTQTGRDIWLLSLVDHKARPFLKTTFEESAPKFSPDGKWMAYSSDESGRREIYVQPFPGPGGKWQISTEGGQEPVWNPKGGELFYRSGSRIMAVEVDTKSGLSAGKPRMLFEGPYLPTSASLPWYDVSPDGQRFLMLKPVDSQATAPTQINVVLNWFEELKQKVPVK